MSEYSVGSVRKFGFREIDRQQRDCGEFCIIVDVTPRVDSGSFSLDNFDKVWIIRATVVNNDEYRHYCWVCGKGFDNEHGLHAHISRVHGGPVFQMYKYIKKAIRSKYPAPMIATVQENSKVKNQVDISIDNRRANHSIRIMLNAFRGKA